MIAIINNNEYALNNYYTETSGRLHLFINCEEHNYDIDTIETDILNNTGIDIYNENSEDINATLSGYTKLIHIEKKYNNGAQIYIMIDVDSVSELIKNMQQDLSTAKSKLASLEPTVNSLGSQITQAVSNLENAVSSFNDLQPVIQENSDRVAQLVMDFQFIEDQDIFNRISILE